MGACVCKACGQRVPRGRGLRSTRSQRKRVTICRECNARIEAPATGRPRVVCSPECELARKVRLRNEAYAAETDNARAWWLSLSYEQRCAAVAWLRRNPMPRDFRPRVVQLWNFYNRREFSCEGSPTAIA